MKKNSMQDRILQIFLENPGIPLSGETLANRLSVSRTAVWKAVGKLRDTGYEITGTPKLGYRLKAPDGQNASSGHFNAAEITALLSPQAKEFFRIRIVRETGSTNSDVRDRGISGEQEGYVLLAESQTAGRGRQGRSFYSPKDSGLYMSILLRPALPASEAVLLTAMAGVAASRAVESLLQSSGSVMIKWVNDLYFHDRKICGILTEGVLSMESGGLDQAVLGLGFNLSEPPEGWPAEIREVAGSIFAEKTSGQDARVRLAAAFLNEFLPLYLHLSEKTFLPEYRARMLLFGREVEVMDFDRPLGKALVTGLDDQCRLLVRFQGEDTITPIGSGEVRVKPVG